MAERRTTPFGARSPTRLSVVKARSSSRQPATPVDTERRKQLAMYSTNSPVKVAWSISETRPPETAATSAGLTVVSSAASRSSQGVSADSPCRARLISSMFSGLLPSSHQVLWEEALEQHVTLVVANGFGRVARLIPSRRRAARRSSRSDSQSCARLVPAEKNRSLAGSQPAV
jgi:hypothetical protein